MKKYMLVPALFFLTILVFSLANAAVIKTVPEKKILIADGVTEYKVFVHVDNTGLDGEPTDAVQWKLLNTPGFEFTDVSKPEYNDFFEGLQMFWEMILPAGHMSARIVTEIPGGPVNDQGDLAVYTFKVPQSATPGIYSFDLNNILLLDPSGVHQPVTEENIQFSVCPIPQESGSMSTSILDKVLGSKLISKPISSVYAECPTRTSAATIGKV